MYRWRLTFFGLSPNDKPKIHEQIFQMCYYGEGGFTHSEVYGMPTYLRQFYYKKLVDSKQEEKKQIDKSKAPSKKGINRAGIRR